MLNQFKPNYQVTTVDFYNTRLSTYYFRNLLLNVYPRLFKQKQYIKKIIYLFQM
jgi:hypothetical protein